MFSFCCCLRLAYSRVYTTSSYVLKPLLQPRQCWATDTAAAQTQGRAIHQNPCLHPGSSPTTLSTESAEHPKAHPSLWLSLRTTWMLDPCLHTLLRMEMTRFTVHCVCSPAPLHQQISQKHSLKSRHLSRQTSKQVSDSGTMAVFSCSLCMMPSSMASFDYCSCKHYLLLKFSGLHEPWQPHLLCKLFKPKFYI